MGLTIDLKVLEPLDIDLIKILTLRIVAFLPLFLNSIFTTAHFIDIDLMIVISLVTILLIY